MYCPRCATQNIESARYCRSCGANLSLVPQALSGHLPEERSDKVEEAIKGAIKRRREPQLGRGIRKSFVGLALILAAVAWFFGTGSTPFGWILFLIPAFILLRKGIAEIVTVLSAAKSENQISIPRSAPSTNQLSPHQEYESLTPPSVTEATTRHMDPIPERRRESN